MWIVPEREIADLLTRDASFDAVEKTDDNLMQHQ